MQQKLFPTPWKVVRLYDQVVLAEFDSREAAETFIFRRNLDGAAVVRKIEVDNAKR